MTSTTLPWRSPKFPPSSCERLWLGIVAYEDLTKHAPPDFLLASKNPNRFNPDGVECVYFSEGEATASEEFNRPFRGLRMAKQPKVTFFADVRLERVLDLTSASIFRILRITERDLHVLWRGRKAPTVAQRLGEAVFKFSCISAIRYPSDAMKSAGREGNNVVIYWRNVKKPDFVRVLGPDRKPPQKWP